MSPNNDSGFKVERFDGSNYVLWSVKMKMYLLSKGLWEAVASEDRVSQAKEQQAHAAIVLSLSDAQMMHVVSASCAKEAWLMLEAFHRTRDMANRLWLKEKFASFQYTSTSISGHVMELEDLVMKMKSADCGPSEEDVCAVMLRSLPASYESLVQAFRMSVTSFRFSDLVSKLIAEEVRQKDATRVEEATALYTSKRKFKKHPKKDQGRRAKGPSGACFNCGKVGHYARHCRRQSSREPREKAEQSNVAFNASEDFASDSWVMDSGASAHMCKEREAFEDYTLMQHARSVSSAKSDVKLKVIGYGTVKLRVWTGHARIDARLENTLHVQDLSRNLFSLTAAVSRGMTVEITRKECVVKRDGSPVATGRKQGFLIYLNVEVNEECHVAEHEAELWHRRLGHASYDTVNAMIKNGRIKGVETKTDDVCDVCATSKQVRKSFKASKEDTELRESARSDVVVCSDVLGPVTPASKSGFKYIVSFILMKSRYVKIYPLRKKSEVPDAFARFYREIKVASDITIKTLRSDNGGEYLNAAMDQFCKAKYIKQEFTVPFNPEQNGMAERMNRTLVEMTRCMLKDSGLDKLYWCEAIMTAVDIRNVLPNSFNKQSSPYEMVFKQKPRISHMRVFGAQCYAHVPKEKRKKLDDSGVKCYFLGYANDRKAYRLLDMDGSIVISRSVTFAEHPVAKMNKKKDEQVVDLLDDQENVEMSTTDKEEVEVSSAEEALRTPPMRARQEQMLDKQERPRIAVPTRASSTPGRDGEEEWMVRPVRKKRNVVRYDEEFPNLRRSHSDLENFDGDYDSLYCFLTEADGEKASTYKEVMKSKNKDQWLQAMNSEMNAIGKHKTWTLVDMPPSKKAIGCKWVFRIKRDTSGNFLKYKARLVAKGFTQRAGIDYDETFAPVARKQSINTVLAIAAAEDLEAENVDVDTAFLYGEVDEEIYMDQPDGFEDIENPTKKCLLQKALYGTKQAARQWNSKLNQHLENQGFKSTAEDPCVFIRASSNEYSIIVIYVDDLMLFCKTKEHIEDIKCALREEFSIKELGDLKYCLGIEIHRDRSNQVIKMNQQTYIKRLSEKFGVESCKDVHTPADSNSKLCKLPEEEAFLPKYPYRELVGALMYLATCTRPDISFAVGEVAKFCERYGKSHWAAAKRILKYLKTTQDLSIVFSGFNKGELIGFADANWAGDLDTRRSTTGYILYLNSSAISWNSKRQPTVATSSTEAEYMSLYSATQEVIWLRSLLKDLQYSVGTATTIFEDNQGCIALAKNPVYHSRTKHIDLKFHFQREMLARQVISLEYKPTEEMVADGFTKSLARAKHTKFLTDLGMLA